MRSRPAAGRSHVDFARVGPGIRDEFGNCLGRYRWIDHHDLSLAANARDRRDVADEIEVELVVERRVACVRRADEEEGVAVRRRTYDRLSADIGAAARPALNDEWLAEPLRQPLPDQTCEAVLRATGGSRHNQAHRLRRISLRPGEARHGWERSSTSYQMQKPTACRFHADLL